MPKAPIASLAPLLFAAATCSDSVLEVQATRPVRRDIENALTTNGRIEAVNRFEVHTALAGSVERILVQRGDPVKRNQELLRLSDTGQAESLTQARARLEGAKARFASLEAGLPPVRRAVLKAERTKLAGRRESAARDLERLERLAARGAVPPVDIEAKRRLAEELAREVEALDVQLASPLALGEREEAQAAVDEAKSGVAEARVAVERLRVLSPSSGVVYSLPVSEGMYLQEGALVARVGILDAVRARIFVDEPDLGRVEQGCEAKIRADAYPGREWTCNVDRLATEVVEMGTRRVGEIQCAVRNPDGRLLPNLAVGVRIVTDRVQAAPSIPRLSVLRGDGRTFVWTLEGGEASRREIRTGVEGPVHVEVREGLDESDIVLLQGEEPISEGQEVKARVPGGSDG